MRNQRFVWALVVGVLVAIGRPAGQPSGQTTQEQPPVVFRVEIDYVEVDAVVTDAAGNLVRDLTIDDFEVFEDGEPQEVTAFSLVDLPIERAERPLFASTPIEPDVRSNDREFDGRVFVLVLDDIHTHPLRTNLVKASAQLFVQRYLGANDIAAVVHTSGRTDAAQEFTSNPRLLRASIDRFRGDKLRSSTLARTDEYYRFLGNVDQSRADVDRATRSRIDDPLDFERGTKAMATLSTLKNVSELLGGIRGRRKAMVLFSEGIDYDIYDYFNAPFATSVLSDTRETIGAATRGNVAFYTIDARGLTSMADDLIELSIIPQDLEAGLDPLDLRRELRVAQDSLRVLAEETGGMAFVDTNDFDDVFERIVEDNTTYYLLGYYPTNDRRDGRFREIEVRVARPELQVRARKGYVAPSGRTEEPELAPASENTSPELRAVMANPLPVSGLTLTATAVPFTGSDDNASVAVILELDGRDLTFTERDGLFSDTVEVSFSAIDSEGTLRGGESQTLALSLRPETHALVAQHGLRALARMDLEPGRYQIRLAARETGAQRAGSVLYDLEVPDFYDRPLSMSGHVLTSIEASQQPTVRADQELQQVLPAAPSTLRDFAADDELTLFIEVYDSQGRTPHVVDITTTVRGDTGQTVFEVAEERRNTELQGERGGYGHVAQIPLQGRAPGLYVLRTEARSRLAPDEPVARELVFRIREGSAAAGR